MIFSHCIWEGPDFSLRNKPKRATFKSKQLSIKGKLSAFQAEDGGSIPSSCTLKSYICMKRKTKMGSAKKKGNFLWRYKTSKASVISSLNSYDFQSDLMSKSDFGEQIYIKKLLEAVYGNHLIVSSKKINLWNLIRENESRLDVLLFRSQIFLSLGSAYQAIKIGKVYVNGRLCSNPYQTLCVGSLITLCPNFFMNSWNEGDDFSRNTLYVCNHLQVDYKIGSFIFLTEAEEGEFPFLIS